MYENALMAVSAPLDCHGSLDGAVDVYNVFRFLKQRSKCLIMIFLRNLSV